MRRFLAEKNPTLSETKKIIEEAISKRAFLTLIICCKVKYQGRAVSHLGWGDRALIIKSDGSFMIHQARNLDPVNWQPPGTRFKLEEDEGRLIIRGIRRKPPESLEVLIRKTYLASYFRGKDDKELELSGYEEDMREMIIRKPQLIEPGFKPISTEYYTDKGFIDILGKDGEGNLMVLELKSRRAGINAFKQLKRYVNCFSDHKNKVRGILIAPSVTEDALELIEKYDMEFIPLKPPTELKKKDAVTLEHFKK